MLITGGNAESLVREVNRIAPCIKGIIDERKPGYGHAVKLFGPSEEKIFKLNDTYRYSAYLKSDDYAELVRIKDRLSSYTPEDKGVSIQFDFNPA